MAARKTPERMCFGCRKRAAKKDLVRFVFKNGGLLLDADQREDGRGVYCHPSSRCWYELRHRPKWESALRLEQGSLKEKDFVDFLNAVRAQFLIEDEGRSTGNRRGQIRL